MGIENLEPMAVRNCVLLAVEVERVGARFYRSVADIFSERGKPEIAITFAYLADGWAGLRVVDVAEPLAPTEVGFLVNPGACRDVVFLDGLAYVADYYAGLRIFDASDPTSPTEIGTYDSPGYAVDVTVSLSRVMDRVVSPEHTAAARQLRALVAAYEEKRDLIALGAYASGSDVRVDRAIRAQSDVEQFLRQEPAQIERFEATVAALCRLVAKYH